MGVPKSVQVTATGKRQVFSRLSPASGTPAPASNSVPNSLVNNPKLFSKHPHYKSEG